jgi:hypothetical protein
MCAKRFVIIGGLDKYSKSFGHVAKYIPIEIAPLSLVPVQKWITEKHGFLILMIFYLLTLFFRRNLCFTNGFSKMFSSYYRESQLFGFLNY